MDSRVKAERSVLLSLSFVTLALTQNLELYEGDVCRNVNGMEWVCKRIRQCDKAIEMLQSGENPRICGFVGDEPVVCCESNSLPTSTTPSTSSPGPTQTSTNKATSTSKPTLLGVKTRKRCREYADYVFINISGLGFDNTEYKIDTCNQLESLIVGGHNARSREFPHMAQIGYGDRSKISWRCGGSLISRHYVLSAAHCTTLYKQPAMWVGLGEYNTKTKTDEYTGDAQTVIHRILHRIDHPDYKPPRAENDIALYRLETDVVFNEFVRPACLQTDAHIAHMYAIAIGWGNTEYGGRASDVLQKVNLTLISHEECSDYYKPNKDTLPRGVQYDSMICAGDTISQHDTCQGDSGGPLQVSHPNFYCTHSLVGVTSFGLGCGVKPGVYTRVSHFIPWIENIVWQ